jgi:hypothetical protein
VLPSCPPSWLPFALELHAWSSCVTMTGKERNQSKYRLRKSGVRSIIVTEAWQTGFRSYQLSADRFLSPPITITTGATERRRDQKNQMIKQIYETKEGCKWHAHARRAASEPQRCHRELRDAIKGPATSREWAIHSRRTTRIQRNRNCRLLAFSIARYAHALRTICVDGSSQASGSSPRNASSRGVLGACQTYFSCLLNGIYMSIHEIPSGFVFRESVAIHQRNKYFVRSHTSGQWCTKRVT